MSVAEIGYANPPGNYCLQSISLTLVGIGAQSLETTERMLCLVLAFQLALERKAGTENIIIEAD